MRHECGLESAGSGRHSSSPALPTRSALGQDAGHKDRRTCRHVLTPGPASSAVSAPASPPGGTRKDAVTFTRHPAPPASRTTVARAPGGGPPGGRGPPPHGGKRDSILSAASLVGSGCQWRCCSRRARQAFRAVKRKCAPRTRQHCTVKRDQLDAAVDAGRRERGAPVPAEV
jgi:hypothetical protein